MSEEKRERRLIPAHELQTGRQVYVERHHAAVELPRQSRPRPDSIDLHIPAEGQWIAVSDWILGAVKRGELVAYDGAPGEPLSAEEIEIIREEILQANEEAEKKAQEELRRATQQAVNRALEKSGEEG